jgi:HK97 family phage major capsid protein
METLKSEVRAELAKDDAKKEDIEAKMKDMQELQSKIDAQRKLDEMELAGCTGGVLVNPASANADPDQKELEAEYTRIFLRGVRRQRISADDRAVVENYIKAAVVHEGGVAEDPDGDSSLIVPQDIQTRINELTRSLNDLSRYVNVQTVNTLSGSRVLEADADMTPFVIVDEYDELQEIDNPKFTPITFKLVKRAGFLPITKELLADTDQNILAYLTKWIAKKHVVTKNSLIITILNTLAKKALANVDAIKTVLNVDLDPAISLSSILLTNQDGYNWLDHQKDDMGRDLLQPDITQPGRMLFRGRPVVVMANRTLPSDTTVGVKAPLIMGNLAELVVLFTRGRYELATTEEGGSAWRRVANELRTVTRDDCKKWDSGAAVYGQLTIEEGA